MNIKPIGKRVLIIETKITEKRASGLIIPGNSEEENVKHGLVQAVGSTVTEIKKNEKVIFEKKSGKHIENAGVKYILLEEEEVLAVIEGDK